LDLPALLKAAQTPVRAARHVSCNQFSNSLCTRGVLVAAHCVEERPEEFLPIVVTESVKEDVSFEVVSVEECVSIFEVKVSLLTRW
jgi:hypothetical protein